MVIRSQVACEQIHEVDRFGARQAVTAFLTSIVVTVLLFGAVIYMARKRPPGTRLTWGEAFIAGAFIFLLFLMIYGVVPDRFLRWADGELKWRTDKIGIPMGPLYGPLHNLLGIGSHGVIAPNGIKFASPFNWASQRLHDWFGLGSGSGFAHNGVADRVRRQHVNALPRTDIDAALTHDALGLVDVKKLLRFDRLGQLV